MKGTYLSESASREPTFCPVPSGGNSWSCCGLRQTGQVTNWRSVTLKSIFSWLPTRQQLDPVVVRYLQNVLYVSQRRTSVWNEDLRLKGSRTVTYESTWGCRFNSIKGPELFVWTMTSDPDSGCLFSSDSNKS